MDLQGSGYTITKNKVMWDDGNTYKATNVQLTTPEGHPMELQFHTPESYELKIKIQHPLYMEARKLTTSPERRTKLENIMQANSRKLTTPPNLDLLRQMKP